MADVLRTVFKRDRLTGQIALGLVGVLCVAAVVFGSGMASAHYKISDVGAWLGAGKKGLVVHANGLAGKVDGKASVPKTMAGHRIQVRQDGGNVLIVDLDTGVVARVDPATFDVGAARKVGDAAGLDLVTGQGQAYAIDQAKGTVQQIDPVTLGAVAGTTTAQLTAPLGSAAIDNKGTLWVPQGNTGQIVPFQAGRAAAAVTVGKPGDTLALTVAGGQPVVTDTTQGSSTIVGTSGALLTVNLPSEVRRQRGGLLAPTEVDGQIVPLLAPDMNTLVLVNAGTGALASTSVQLPAHKFGVPQNLGSRVYIPDTTAGALLVYDSTTGRLQPPVKVPGAQGHPLEVFTQDGLLWANNPDGSNAVVVDKSGRPKTIGKYDPNVAGGGKHPVPTSGGRGPGPRHTEVPQVPVPTPSVTKKPWEAPDAPAITLVQNGDGNIVVDFAPGSAGGKASDFVLLDGSGAALAGTVAPATIPAAGPGYQFQVTGLSCAQEYTFTVAVRYTDDHGKAQQKLSAPSAKARPCVPPATPTLSAGNIRNHGLTLTWSATTPSGTTLTLTGSQGLAGGGVTVAASGSKSLTVPNSLTTTYTYTLTASSGAGTTSASAQAAVNPKNHTPVYRDNTHNGDDSTFVRPVAAANGNDHVAEIAKDVYVSIPIYCQVKGASYTDPYNSNLKTNIWNYVKYDGAWGYLPDMYMATSRTGTTSFSPEITWQCT